MTSNTLLELASDISKQVAILNDYLRESGNAQPSFDPKGPAAFPKDATEPILSARRQLIWQAKQLQLLALGPTESLQWLALTGVRLPRDDRNPPGPPQRAAEWRTLCVVIEALDTATLRWLYHYNIPEAVPSDGSISFEDLAQKTSISQRTLTRILRHAMTNNIFRETKPGRISHTSLSLQLTDVGNPVRGVVGHQTEVVFPAASRMVEAHDRHGTADEDVRHAPFNTAFDTEEPALSWVASNPHHSARFTESMKSRASSGPFNTIHTVQGFDWNALGSGTVIDVGGSAGQVSKAIAAAAPELHCVVQDLPAMVEKGVNDLEPELSTRITFEAHDFFEPQPRSEPAVFFLRQILHDWPDPDAIAVLNPLVAKMGPHTKLLINDVVMPEPHSVHPLQEKYVRSVDMMMLSMFNGLERTRADWDDLIKRTDPTLSIESIEYGKGSALALIQIRKRV